MVMNIEQARVNMVENQVRPWEVLDGRVLEVLGRVRREDFVAAQHRQLAFADLCLPLGHGEVMMKPVVEGRVLQALELAPADRVLEIGTGSGYQAAVLAALCGNVYTVERIEELLRDARRRFRKLGIDNIRSRHDDGKLGWPEFAPYDAIMLTAAGESVDPALFAQLAPDGVLVAPVGPAGAQRLLRYRRDGEEWKAEMLGHVSFVPLLGGVT